VWFGLVLVYEMGWNGRAVGGLKGLGSIRIRFSLSLPLFSGLLDFWLVREGGFVGGLILSLRTDVSVLRGLKV
jgi:hypothetical protein